jgi:hypothetical protein
MTTFARASRKRLLVVPRPKPTPEPAEEYIEPEIHELAAAIARGLAREHHAAEIAAKSRD